MNHRLHSDSLPINRPTFSHAWTPLFAPRAVSHVATLRGGAQSHLLRCDDGHAYVVKFRNNPQGYRILANEWIATAVARYIGIETPNVTPIWLDDDFLRSTPEVAIRMGNRRVPVEPGYHFASRFVGDDDHTPFDFLPDTLLNRVVNLDHFVGALVVDKLLYNADARQCVFVSSDGEFRAHMIDFGYVFNGPNWDIADYDLTGLYHRSLVYDSLRTAADLDPWLSRIGQMPFSIFSDALQLMPAEWLAPTDRDPLLLLLRTAHRRRRDLRTTLAGLFARRRTHFTAWLSAAA